MENKKYDYLISPNGEKLAIHEIKEYMEMKKELLKNIRSSSQFNQELESGNLDYYHGVLEKLKLATPNNEKIEDQEVYDMFFSESTQTKINQNSIDKFQK